MALPFPWSDENGLALVLANPSLWPRVFPDPDARRAIKAAAKHSLAMEYQRLAWGRNVTDDRFFGPCAVALLERRSGRKRLEREFRKAFHERALWVTIANRLFKHCVLEDDDWEKAESLPQPRDVCVERHGKQFLDPERFAAWLKQHTVAENGARVALFAAAFALLQPQDASKISDALLTHAPDLRCLVLPRVREDQDQGNDLQQGASKPASEAEQGMPEPALRARIAEVRRHAKDLADKLRCTSDALESKGTLDEQAVLSAIRGFADARVTLQDAVLKEAGALGIETHGTNTPLSIPEMEQCVEKIASAREHAEKRASFAERVSQLFKQIALLECEGDDALLQPVRQSASGLLETARGGAPADDSDVQLVLHGKHPLQRLLRFVQHLRILEDEEWAELRREVESAFGPALAVVVARGKVGMRKEMTPVDEETDVATCATRRPPAVTEPPTRRAASAVDEANGDLKETDVKVSGSSEPAVASSDLLSKRTTIADAPISTEEAKVAADVRALRPDEADVATRPTPRDAVKPTVTHEQGQPAESFQRHRPGATASTSSLADFADEASGGDRAAALVDLALAFVRDDQVCLAMHLAEHVEASACQDGESSPLRVPAAVFRAIAASPHVGPAFGDVHELYCDALTELFTYIDNGDETLLGDETLRLLTIAATLKPALIGPTTDAVTILRAACPPHSLAELTPLCDAIVEFSQYGSRVSPQLLKGVVEYDLWRDQLRELCDRADGWLSHARQGSIIYAPTTGVWHNWLADDGPLGSLVNAVIRNDRARTKDVEQAIQRWHRLEAVDEELKRTDRRLRGRKADLRPIEARAKSALRKKVVEAVTLLQDWLNLLAAEPEQVENYTRNAIAKCRQTVLRHLEPIDRVLTQYAGAEPDDIGRAASAAALRRAVDQLKHVFDPAQSGEQSPASTDVLNLPLLRLHGLALDDDHRPRSIADAAVSEAFLLAARRMPTWEEAFEAHCHVQNFAAASSILDAADAGHIYISEPGERRLALNEHLCEARATLQRSCKELENAAQRALFDGVLSHSEYQNIAAGLEEIDVGGIADLRPHRQQLEQLHQVLERARAAHVSEVEEQLAELKLSKTDPDVAARIRRLLDAGDVRTALEFLALREQGQELPPETPSRRPTFFPGFVEELEAVFQGRQVITPESVRAVRNRQTVGTFSLAKMPPPQAREAAAILEAWLQICNKSSDLNLKVAKVLRGLGFEDVNSKQVSGRPKDNYIWFDVRVSSLSDRDVCPIPGYGSDANGRYNVLVLWGKPLEGDIVSKHPPEGMTAPVIVFYIGLMSVRRRRDLAHRCRRDRRSLLVIDEALLLFAAREGERRARLAAVLQGALQFTVAEPYTTTAGFVPPEMFYGRNEELERLVKPNNVHLVYGGRQLGKTALLRHLEREHHAPEHGRIVRWIDLTNQWGVGLNRPIADIWVVMSNVLCEYDVVPKNVTKPDTLEKHIKEWLSADQDRQILLLLDESDLFLESDSRGNDGRALWAHTRRLKALCESTNRRFKFVFAGLHNVQRSSRDPNSPIAHLGTAVCIGPFLTRREMEQAREMVQRPFECLGYNFSSGDLVMRILAYTNYYPSLIQLFCKHLLDYLGGDRASFDQRRTPPYEVTARHIEDAYQSRALHSAIVERFNWTLRLDERYRAIALFMAHEAQVHKGGYLLRSGFSVTKLREGALTAWPAGFQGDASIDAFQTIVDEMVGLGVLRRTDDGRYTFRSPNVVKLLGTEDQILESLIQLADQEPQIQYRASSFRRSDPAASWRRSPLTAQQEASLILPNRQGGVTILFGTKLSGINEVGPFLKLQEQETTELRIIETQPLSDLSAFEQELLRWLATAEVGVTMLLTPIDTQWNSEWIRLALERMRRRRSAVRKVNIILFSDAKATWGRLPIDLPTSTRAFVKEISLKPWSDDAVRTLLDSLGAAQGVEQRRWLFEVTGNWHALIQHVASSCAEDPSRFKELLKELEKSVGTDDARSVLELPSEARDVMRAAAQLMPEPVSVEELVALAPEAGDAPFVQRVFEWADRLQFARPSGPDRWLLNPFVAKLLQ